MSLEADCGRLADSSFPVMIEMDIDPSKGFASMLYGVSARAIRQTKEGSETP